MRKLLCKLSLPFFWFWFHKPEIVETYDSQTRKLRCTICGKYFAMSDRYQSVMEWDEEYEQIVCAMYGLPRTKL
jgi:hypothetical protein